LLHRSSVVLVVLFSDSLHAIFPAYSTETYKFLSLFILIPTAFLPLRIISYTSLLSVFSTLFIAVVLVVGGFTKYDSPGSLYQPVPTDWWPAGSTELGLSFGIFMAGVSLDMVSKCYWTQELAC
jgi:vesicular inhibitory amino acid transporter